MARPRQPLIDRRAVIEAALSLIDTEGIDGLSMRTLASRIGVNAASLYHHFDDKDEILDGVAQLALVEQYPIEIDQTASWDDQIVALSLGAYQALMLHPNLVPMLFRRMDRHFAPASHHHVTRLLLEGGFPDEMLLPVLDSLEGLLIGLASMDAHATSARPYKLVEDGRHPINKAVRANRLASEARYQLALRALLDGWIAKIDR